MARPCIAMAHSQWLFFPCSSRFQFFDPFHFRNPFSTDVPLFQRWLCLDFHLEGPASIVRQAAHGRIKIVFFSHKSFSAPARTPAFLQFSRTLSQLLACVHGCSNSVCPNRVCPNLFVRRQLQTLKRRFVYRNLNFTFPSNSFSNRLYF
jgi:hypothetical protein